MFPVTDLTTAISCVIDVLKNNYYLIVYKNVNIFLPGILEDKIYISH